MQKVTIYICILGLILFMVIPVHSEEPRLVKVAAFNYYPGIFKDKDGQVKGFYVDALADLAKKENIRIEYIYGSWNEGLERIRSGQVDLVTSAARTPERETYMDFVPTPLLTVWGELYVRNDSAINGIRQLEGKKIAIMKGDFNAASFKELAGKFNIRCEYLELPGFEAVFKAVSDRKADAGVVNSTFGMPTHKKYKLRPTGLAFNPFNIHFAVAKGKNQELASMLERYLLEWRYHKDSVYSIAVKKWGHGSHESYELHEWLVNGAIALSITVIIAAAFIIMLRRQVRQRTEEILQRKAELRESEARYRSIFENSRSVMLIINPENGAIIDGNPAASSFYGWTRSQMQQMNISDINTLPPDELKMQMKQARDENCYHFIFKHRLANGSIRDVEIFSGPVQVNSTGMLFSIIHDITERKMVEETLLFLLQCGTSPDDENFFKSLARHLAETLEMQFVCIDRLVGEALEAETVAIFHDGMFEDNVRYSLADTPCGQVVGKTICRFDNNVRHLFPNDIVLQDLMAEGYAGTTLWSFDGKPIGLISVISREPLKTAVNVESILKIVAIRAAAELERTQAEELLQEEKDRYQALVDDAPVAIFVNKNDRIALVNNACMKLFGAESKEQLLGRSPFELFAPEYHDIMRERIDRIHKSGEPMPLVEEQIIRLDGAPLFVEVSSTPFRMGGETAIHVVLLDISERKGAEEKQQQLEEQLRHSQRMEAIGTLAGGIAHDFNNILTAVIGYAHISLLGLPEDAPQRAHIKNITEAANRATHLTRDLLLFSRKQPTLKKPVDLNETITNTKSFLQRVIGEQIHLTTRFYPAPIIVNADPQQLDQVLINLATNARDAMTGGGRITISTEMAFLDESSAAAHGLEKAGKYGLIRFEDTGCGISHGDIPKIFDPFFTTKEIGKGTGLGLPIVYGILKNHDGAIKIESSPGVGTAIIIHIPCSEEKEVVKGNPESEEILPRGSETILLAEDSEHIRKMAEEILVEFGYRVITAVDGEDAVRLFNENIREIDLLIFDMVMPHLGGYEAYQQIKSIRPEIPIIFTTGYAPEAAGGKITQEMAGKVIQKPFSIAKLLKSVRAILDRDKNQTN